MSEEFHRPVLRPTHEFDDHWGAEDPAVHYTLARDTAWALLDRVRGSTDREGVAQNIVERMLVADTNGGLDDIAQLWSQASARSLPGALWRLYLVRAVVRNDPESTAYAYRRGAEALSTIDPVVSGAVAPTGPEEISALSDRILTGVFSGDLGIALDRAASFCRVLRSGYIDLATDVEAGEPERAQVLTTRGLRYSQFADDFRSVASLWRSGSLD
ncbi:hypothetical protein GCM10022198_22280 [Klugiella xanthotipulae]|uniref:DNA-directed RNA polymerase subunit beta n=1 Tax=Klugiella xanthotipulae TaxID=244735 RepID=A0A543HYQ1_9MICO|nr:DNA-directed RNA polymerase subunit beta [Klugiella xanthotipulae]TQM63375.1 hypothetical protein FB466_1636 [Klugiella xanthotipulae]